MSYYITRIFNNKLKLGVILFIFVAPILDILMVSLFAQIEKTFHTK